MSKKRIDPVQYVTTWPTSPGEWDSGNWSRFQKFEAGTWIVVTLPEYRIGGILAGLVVDRNGVTIAELHQSFTVGEDKKDDRNPFDSPNMKDCRPEGVQFIADDDCRQVQAASERWQTWPGKV